MPLVVALINGEPGEYLAIVPSQTRPDLRSYEIRRALNGEPFCTCPAWFYGKTRPCKHLNRLTVKLGARPVAAAPVVTPAPRTVEPQTAARDLTDVFGKLEYD